MAEKCEKEEVEIKNAQKQKTHRKENKIDDGLKMGKNYNTKKKTWKFQLPHQENMATT